MPFTKQPIMKKLIIFLITVIFANFLFGQQFFETPFSEDVDGLYFSCMDFGDIDNDGDIDMVIIGNLDPGVISKVYKNEGNNFVEFSSSLPSVNVGTIELFDSDNDGDLDVLLSGQTENFTSMSFIMTNDGNGNFTDSDNQEIIDLTFSSSSISDVDADGDLDILLNGFDDTSARTDLYLNDGNGNYTLDTGNSFVPADDGDAVFADVDNDGDEDLFVVGWDENSIPMSHLYINDGAGNFTQSESEFVGVLRASILPVDVDGDDDIDVLISGIVTSSLHQTKLYLNDGLGNFSESTTGSFSDIGNGSLTGSDIDLDGDIDILLSGNEANSFTALTELYINNGDGSFLLDDVETIEGFILGQAEFVDFDQDGDDDLFLTGLNSDLRAIHQLYENAQIISSVSEIKQNNQTEFFVYPNIVSGGSEFSVEINSVTSQEVSLEICDSYGKVLDSFLFEVDANSIGKKVLQSPTQPGTYFIKPINGKFSKKLIVVD